MEEHSALWVEKLLGQFCSGTVAASGYNGCNESETQAVGMRKLLKTVMMGYVQT